MGVDLGGLRAGVAEEFLYVTDVGTGLEEVGSEAVAEGVGTRRSGDAGAGSGEFDDFLSGTNGERSIWACAGEEPGGGSVFTDVLAEGEESAFGQECVAVLTTLAGADVNELAVGVDIVDTESDDFTDAQAGGIEENEQCVVFDVVGSMDDATGVVAPENGGESAVAARPGHGSEGIGVSEDVTKEEA